jgi:transcriptional regulator with XRE-family HTH domain
VFRFLYRLRVPWDDLDWTEQDRVRKARLAAGFVNTSDLSAATGWPNGGVTRHTIERWEKGVHRPQPGTVALVLGVIAAKLQVDPAALSRWISTGESLTGSG